jgi:hypothetical protein
MTTLRTAAELVRFMGYLERQPLPLDVECSPHKATRSSEQNRLLFGVVYPPIADAMGYEVADIHEYMLGEHFGWVEVKVPKKRGNAEGIESRPFRTTTTNENGKRSVLKKDEFSRFLETVERIAAKAGVFIPLEAAA